MKLKDNPKGSPHTIINVLSSIKAAEMYCRSRLVLIFQISNVQLTYQIQRVRLWLVCQPEDGLKDFGRFFSQIVHMHTHPPVHDPLH